jgi:hypothetical protein
MANASAGAISALVINSLLVLVLTGGVIMYQSELAGNFYVLLAACMAIVLCVYPPTVATYINLTGTAYSYENYILQVFVPVAVGFLIFLSILFFDLLEFDAFHEQFIIFLGSVSILSSSLSYAFMLFRIKYNGT